MASFDEVIPPGQVGRVIAKINTKEFRGPVDRSITLMSNDPDQPQVAVWLHVEAAGSVLLLPRGVLDLRPGHPTLPAAAKLLVRQDPGEKGEMHITDVKVDAPWLKVASRKVEAPEEAADGLPPALAGDVVLTVEPAGEVPEGTHRQTIRFATGLPTEPSLEIPVSVFLRARLQVSAEQIVFGAPEADGARRAAVLVSLREDVAKDPLAVEGPPEVQSTFDSAGANRFNVRLTWTGKGEPRGAVVFRAGAVTRSVPIATGPPSK